MFRNSKTIDRSGQLTSAQEILEATEPQETTDPGGLTNATSSGANGQAGIVNSAKGFENSDDARPAVNGANTGFNPLGPNAKAFVRPSPSPPLPTFIQGSSKDVETTSEPIARQEHKEPVRQATYPPPTQRVEGSYSYPLAPVRHVDPLAPSGTPASQPRPTSTTTPQRVVPYNTTTPYGTAPLPAPYNYPGPSQPIIPSSSQMYASPAPMSYTSPSPAPNTLSGSGPFPYSGPPQPYRRYSSTLQSSSSQSGPPGIYHPGTAPMRTPQSMSYSGAPTPQSYAGAPTPQTYAGRPTPQSYAGGTPAAQTYSSPAAYPQPPQSHVSPAAIGYPPNAPLMPSSDLPQQQPVVTTVGPTIIPSRKRTDAFVANDPFRPHSSRVDKPSDNLTFDDIPMPALPIIYALPPPVRYDPEPVPQIPPPLTSPATKPPQQPEPAGRPSTDTNPPDHTPLEPINETVPTNDGGPRPPSPVSDRPSSPYRHPTSYPPLPVEAPIYNPSDPYQMPYSPILPNWRPYDPNDPSTFPTSRPYSPIYPRPYSPYTHPPIVRDSFWSRVSDFFRWPFGRPMSKVPLPPLWEPPNSSWDTTPSWEEEGYTKAAVNFVTGTLPSQMYLNLLLRLPSLYFSRVARIFEEADLTLPEIKKMALETASQGKVNQFDILAFESNVPPQYKKLKSTWESFIDSVMREWKTFNIISVLLLSAILTILQIEAAANDPVTRYAALFSLVCALISLLFGCMYIIRFGSMRKTYKAAEWALEAKKTKTVIWWNVWVLLAMPAVWLTWSIILYIACIMSFVWRTSAQDSDPPANLSSSGLLIVRIIITVVLGLGILYGSLIMGTFRRYGDAMDRAWKQRIDGWIEEKYEHQPSSYIPPSQYQPGSYGPYLDQYGSTYQPPMQNIPSYADLGYGYSSDPQVQYTGDDYGPTLAPGSYAPPPEPYDSASQSRASTPGSTSSTVDVTRSNTLQNKTTHLEPENKTRSGGLHVYHAQDYSTRNPPPPLSPIISASPNDTPPKFVPKRTQLAVPPPPSLSPIPATPFIPPKGIPRTAFTGPELGNASSKSDLNLLIFSPAEEDADVHENWVRFRSPLVSAQGSISPWGGTSFAGSESPSAASDLNVTGIGDQARTPTDAAQVTADSPSTSSGTNAIATSQENADCEDTV